MTKITVEIAETATRLSLENHLLKIMLPDGRVTTVPVAELQSLIVANPATTVSVALLAELAATGVSVVISGKNRMPLAMQLPLDGNYLQNERFRAQINASLPLRKRLWQIVVREKIRRQGLLLLKLRGNDAHLLDLSKKVGSGDPDNMEGRAAVVYWKNLFNIPFQRDREANDNNVLLNYGYAILRAMTARACCGAGLHPTLGIAHHNRYNAYCLADDLMEPFRPLVDQKVSALNPNNHEINELSGDLRKELLQALQEKVSTGDCQWPLSELLRISASQVAESYVSGEVKLKYL